MPLYMDVHNSRGRSAAGDVADAHMKDLQEQAAHDVDYKQYWVDERPGRSSASSRPRTPRRRTPSTGRPTASSRTRSTRSKRAPRGPALRRLVRLLLPLLEGRVLPG